MNAVECPIQRVWIQSPTLCKRRLIPSSRCNAYTSLSTVILGNFCLFSLASHTKQVWWPPSLQCSVSGKKVFFGDLSEMLFVVALFFHRFPIPYWHYSCEERSRLSGKRSRGTSLQVNQHLIVTEKMVADPSMSQLSQWHKSKQPFFFFLTF